MNDAFVKIGVKWRPYGLLGIWRDAAGIFYVDDNQSLGPLYFGLAADIEEAAGRVCLFRDMPEGRAGLEAIWTS